MALTPKQENFCRLVAGGKDYTNAYLAAYDWSGSKAGAAIEGTKLANREDIQIKIRALMKPKEIAVQRENINARQKQIDFIQSRIALCVEKDDEQSIIRYTDMLNKIYAMYKETETEQKPESVVSDLDLTTLKKMVQ